MQLVLRAQRYPKLLRFLCQLFPFRFPGFLVTLGDDVLPQVEAAVTEQPWIFGFNKVSSLSSLLIGIQLKATILEQPWVFGFNKVISYLFISIQLEFNITEQQWVFGLIKVVASYLSLLIVCNKVNSLLISFY